MRIAIITSGAAGMFCGSCMKDNTLATALRALGHDTLLIPTYTPLTTDEADTSQPDVFFGGVNVYLQQSPWTSWFFRRTPRFVDRMLNGKKFLKWVGRFAGSTDYSKLGALTRSMLAGEHGNQKKEVLKLVEWMKAEFSPDAIILSNALVSGIVPTLRKTFDVPIFVTWQGDDIFLDDLPDYDRRRCIHLIQGNDSDTTGYIATSEDYAERMSRYFSVNRSKVHVVYPGIQHASYQPVDRGDRPPTLGFFARIAPEKGFHNLVDSFMTLKRTAGMEQLKLRFGGWLGKKNKAYFQAQMKKLAEAGYTSDTTHVDCPDLKSKVAFFQSIDVMSIPTEYQEPKGLTILEAWASGVPVVQPAHGSFPELINKTGGGILFRAGEPVERNEALIRLFNEPELRRQLAERGRDGVTRHFTAQRMAEATLQVLQGT